MKRSSRSWQVTRSCPRVPRMNEIGPPWSTVDDAGTLCTASYGFAFGTSRTTIVQLGSDHYLVYSPGQPLLQAAKLLLPKSAKLVLLAPSGGHTMGLAPWLAHFDNACVIAAKQVHTRLHKTTQISEIGDVASYQSELPEFVRLHQPPNSRLGEVWVRVVSGGTTYWLVCDALMNLPALSPRFALRLLQRVYGLRIGLAVGSVFRRGMRDKKSFRTWATTRFAEVGPQVLIPCHGEVDGSADVGERLQQIIIERF